MAQVADDAPPTIAELLTFSCDGRAWVCTDDADKPIAYLLVEIVDGDAFVEQVSVHPDYAHRRLGSSLIDIAAAWARRHALAALTLTTFAQVPWNRPYYERLGFHVVPDTEWGAGLRTLRRAEAARGLDRWPPVVMRRPVDSAGPTEPGRPRLSPPRSDPAPARREPVPW